VSGIDISPAAILEANKRLMAAHVVDLDRDMAPYGAESFDTILYGDVLEHLKFPWNVVRDQRKLMAPGGRAFCSLPNVGHHRVIRRLLMQRWEYESEGIFDYTHLRFFTRRPLEAMFRSAGYDQVATSELWPLTFKGRMLNRLTFGALRDLLIRQWWVEASIGNSVP
jgi:SAM-dependent methyltransferase